MSRFLVPLLALAISGCGRDRVSVGGSVAAGEHLTAVWVAGDTLRTPLVADSFHLVRPASDTLVLRFARGDDSVGMTIEGLVDGGALVLDGVWAEKGLAYPSRVGLAGPRTVTINRLRMAGDGVLPDRINVPATVLAVADEGDALLVRPTDGDLPDLRVVLSPVSIVRSEGGDTIDASELQFGDSLRLSGSVQDGYVAATEAAVAPGAAARIARRAAARRAERERERAAEEESAAAEGHRNFLERLLGIHHGREKGKKPDRARGGSGGN